MTEPEKQEDESPPLRNHEDLRQILRENPADEEALLELSAGLFGSLCRGSGAKDPARRRERVEELGELARRHGHQAVRAFHAMGLFNAIVDSHQTGDRAARDAYLGCLRETADHEAGRRHLALALHNAAAWAAAERDRAASDGYLTELRDLQRGTPGDDTARWCLGQALLHAAAEAETAGDRPRHDALFEEARRLAE
ncbi:MAG: hypothetical protein MUE73_13780 [Planctomycetes bacterium]|jgi:hypothetical protein|nr:hypothetical protein [Planctomycetota bacterium]